MQHYGSWETAEGLGPNMKAFIDGSALFLGELGLPMEVGQAFVALVAFLPSGAIGAAALTVAMLMSRLVLGGIVTLRSLV